MIDGLIMWKYEQKWLDIRIDHPNSNETKIKSIEIEETPSQQ